MTLIRGVACFSDDPHLKSYAKTKLQSLSNAQPTSSLIQSTFCTISLDNNSYDNRSAYQKTLQGCIAVAGRLIPSNRRGKQTSIPDLNNIKCQIIRSGGEWLVNNFWGEYVVAIADEESQRLYLFRDPTGLNTVYYARNRELFMFSSDLASLSLLLPNQPPFDEQFLACYIVFGTHASRHTPFQNVHELRPGHYLEVSSETVTERPYWNPISLAQPSAQRSADSAELLQTFIQTVGGCLEDEAGVYVDLSGGLDSSALLAAAVQTSRESTKLVAGTVFHPSIASATELEFAREVTSLLDVELIELNGEELLPMTPGHESVKRWDKPSAQLLHLRLHESHAREASLHGCRASANGYGGDQVFHARMERLNHLIDYLGLETRSRFWGELRTSLIWGVSIPRALAQTGKALFDHYIRRRPDYLCHSTPTWATSKLLDLADSSLLLPPYWRKLRTVPPLKARQILEVYDSSAHVDRGFRSFGLGMHHPFLAFPLVQIGLSLPVDQLIAGGVDRVVFRQAMANLLPASIVGRCTKGEYSGMYQMGLRMNLKNVETLITNGRSARTGWLCKDKLRAELRTAAQGYSADISPLLNLIAAELWFQAWEVDDNREC